MDYIEHNTNQIASKVASMDFEYYLKIILRSKLKIASFILIFVLAGVFYLNKATPIYSAGAKIQADPVQPNASARDQYVMNSMVFLFYETQYEIIQSRSIAENVVDELGLVEKYKIDQLSNPEMNESTVSSLLGDLSEKLGLSKIKQEGPSQLSDEQIRTMLAQGIQSRLRLDGGKQSQIIDIFYSSPDPEHSAAVANAVADAYISFGLESRLDQIKETSEWLSEQLESLRKQLQISEERLREFRINANLMDTEQQSRLTNAQFQTLNAELIKAKTELSSAEELYSQVKTIRAQNGDFRSLRPVISSNTIRDLVREESTLLRKVTELSERYGDKHPRMIAARSDLASAKDSLKRETAKIVGNIEKEYLLAKVQVDNVENLIKNTTQQLQAYQGDTFEVTRLEREVENNRRIYETFLGRLMETDVSSEYDASNIRIIDRATVPKYPIKPSRKLILGFAVIFGTVCGIIFCLISELSGAVFRTPDQVESIIGLPVLGLSPLVKKSKNSISPEKQYLADQRSSFSEAINTIRTGILLSDLTNPPKSILVTSTLGSEGKTTLAINLSVALSKLGKTLLVELDLRKPAIGTDLDIESNIGIADLLAGNSDAKIFHRVSGAPQLNIMTCGTIPDNPTELIGSSKFFELFDSLKNKYEYIVVDTPPTIPVTDSCILSKVVDATIVAVKADETKQNMAKETVKRLKASKANITGLVLTQASPKKMKYYGEHYYQENFYGVQKS